MRLSSSRPGAVGLAMIIAGVVGIGCANADPQQAAAPVEDLVLATASATGTAAASSPVATEVAPSAAIEHAGHGTAPSTTPAAAPREAALVVAREPAPAAASAPAPAAVVAPVLAPASIGGASTAYTYGGRASKRVALTFDAGSDYGYTTEILDTLARERAVATFGVTGAWAEQHPAAIRRIAADGHRFINHTWDHGSFTGFSTNGRALTRAQRWDQLDRTEAAIQRIAGATTLPYFRPPYGDLDASVLADVGARGYTVTAMWAVDSLGWNGLSAAAIEERTLRLTSPGAIVIFHVGSQSQDGPALASIIQRLRASGYEFVTLGSLIAQ